MGDPLVPGWMRRLMRRFAIWQRRNKHCARCGESLRGSEWAAKTDEGGLVCPACMVAMLARAFMEASNEKARREGKPPGFDVESR